MLITSLFYKEVSASQTGLEGHIKDLRGLKQSNFLSKSVITPLDKSQNSFLSTIAIAKLLLLRILKTIAIGIAIAKGLPQTIAIAIEPNFHY